MKSPTSRAEEPPPVSELRTGLYKIQITKLLLSMTKGMGCCRLPWKLHVSLPDKLHADRKFASENEMSQTSLILL